MSGRKTVVFGLLLCLLLVPSANAISRDESSSTPVVRFVRWIQQNLPWIIHVPSDDGVIIPKP